MDAADPPAHDGTATMFQVSRLALFLAATAAVSAQTPLADAAPLDHPARPGTLAGLTICLDLGDQPEPDPCCVRAAHYLARLVEKAGGRSVPRWGAPGETATELVARIGDAVVVEWMPLDHLPKLDEPQDPLLAALARHATASWRAAPRAADQPGVRIGVPSDAILTGHREACHGVLAGLVDWWRRQRSDEPGARAASTAPSLPNSLWPVARPPESAAEINRCIANWRRTRGPDPSQVYLRAEVTGSAAKGWHLHGATELALLQPALEQALLSVGIRVQGALRLLPDDEALGAAPFAIARRSATLTWSRPGRATGDPRLDPAGQYEETMVLGGEPLRLLDADGEHLLAHARSGYLGWIPEVAVTRCDRATFEAALDEPGSSEHGEGAAREAVRRLGVPYVFGGRSDLGIDCSGLMMTSWAERGVYLPRDARQQILCGDLVATAQQRAPLRAGDLLFFANDSGRISHVGMSLGGWRFVHATPPEVTVGSLDPDDPFYVERAARFVLAKRVAR